MGMFWVIVLPCVSPQTKEAAGSQLWLTGVPLLSSVPALPMLTAIRKKKNCSSVAF